MRGLRRAKFSTFVSIFTIFISLAVIGLFVVFIFNVNWIMTQIKSRMELEIFIDNSFTKEQIDTLRSQIEEVAGIESVRYVSKEEAAEVFRNEVGRDIFEILDDNPLPPSFQVKLRPEVQTSSRAENISDQLANFDGVDEVLYRRDILVILERYFRLFLIISLGIGLVLAIGSIFLIYNTIKLIILSRRSVIEIMKLVGATRRFIRRPFIVEGVIQGIVGGTLAALFFSLLFQILKTEIPELIVVTQAVYPILIILGALLGLIGSMFALRKFLKY
ncbi:MAG: ABC transporter permease [bacterium]|nr:ABC transporter permease [bacterium]